MVLFKIPLSNKKILVVFVLNISNLIHNIFFSKSSIFNDVWAQSVFVVLILSVVLVLGVRLEVYFLVPFAISVCCCCFYFYLLYLYTLKFCLFYRFLLSLVVVSCKLPHVPYFGVGLIIKI